jgi:hypothetical protein
LNVSPSVTKGRFGKKSRKKKIIKLKSKTQSNKPDRKESCCNLASWCVAFSVYVAGTTGHNEIQMLQ